MKNRITLLLISFLVLLGCTNETLDNENTNTNVRQEQVSFAPCNHTCATTENNNCGDCITVELMKGFLERYTTVQWNNCSSLDPQASDCFVPNPATSQIKLCYSDDPTDCELYVELSSLPSCILCASTSFPFCEKLKAECKPNGNDMVVTLSSETSDLVIEYAYTITGDPTIRICCERTFSNGAKYKYCCDGLF